MLTANTVIFKGLEEGSVNKGLATQHEDLFGSPALCKSQLEGCAPES